MTERENLFLVTHQAETLEQAAKLASQGDTGAAIGYLLNHPLEIRQFCEELRTIAPIKINQILTGILSTLLTDDEAMPFVIEADLPLDLEACKKAALEKNTAAVVKYLKTHPGQIKPFVESLMGSLKGQKMAWAFAARAIRVVITRKGEMRDSFDVIKEIIEFIILNNTSNIERVRDSISFLLQLTDTTEADEAALEYLGQTAQFTLGNHPVIFRAKFRSLGQGEDEDPKDPEPFEAASDLMIEEPGASEERLREICRPLTMAEIYIHPISAVADVPGYVLVPKDQIRAALKDKRLAFRQTGDSEYALVIPLRAA
ncbi:MAG: hypothetical protein V1908_03485 [Candidatus Peregrinibacteria bacterium]